MSEHRNLTGDALHEPKGIENASNGQVYVANGSGSGSWKGSAQSSYSLTETLSDASINGNKIGWVIPTSGTLSRVLAQPSFNNTATAGVLNVYKNGTRVDTPVVNLAITNPATTSQQTFNIAVVAGDVIELRVSTAAGASGPVYLSAKINV